MRRSASYSPVVLSLIFIRAYRRDAIIGRVNACPFLGGCCCCHSARIFLSGVISHSDTEKYKFRSSKIRAAARRLDLHGEGAASAIRRRDRPNEICHCPKASLCESNARTGSGFLHNLGYFFAALSLFFSAPESISRAVNSPAAPPTQKLSHTPSHSAGSQRLFGQADVMRFYARKRPSRPTSNNAPLSYTVGSESLFALLVYG